MLIPTNMPTAGTGSVVPPYGVVGLREVGAMQEAHGSEPGAQCPPQTRRVASLLRSSGRPLVFTGKVQRNGRADESSQSRFVNLVALVKVDRTSEGPRLGEQVKRVI